MSAPLKVSHFLPFLFKRKTGCIFPQNFIDTVLNFFINTIIPDAQKSMRMTKLDDNDCDVMARTIVMECSAKMIWKLEETASTHKLASFFITRPKRKQIESPIHLLPVVDTMCTNTDEEDL